MAKCLGPLLFSFFVSSFAHAAIETKATLSLCAEVLSGKRVSSPLHIANPQLSAHTKTDAAHPQLRIYTSYQELPEERLASLAYLKLLDETGHGQDKLLLVSSIEMLDVPYEDAVLYNKAGAPIKNISIKSLTTAPNHAAAFTSKLSKHVSTSFPIVEKIANEAALLAPLSLLETNPVTPGSPETAYKVINLSPKEKAARIDRAKKVIQLMGYDRVQREQRKHSLLIHAPDEIVANYTFKVATDGTETFLEVHGSTGEPHDSRMNLTRIQNILQSLPLNDSVTIILGKFRIVITKDGVSGPY